VLGKTSGAGTKRGKRGKAKKEKEEVRGGDTRAPKSKRTRSQNRKKEAAREGVIGPSVSKEGGKTCGVGGQGSVEKVETEGGRS